jgi:hypothetical protein
VLAPAFHVSLLLAGTWFFVAWYKPTLPFCPFKMDTYGGIAPFSMNPLPATGNGFSIVIFTAGLTIVSMYGKND